MRIVSVGEVLWDIIEQQEHLGGAPLNFAAHSARLGHEVRLISGVGDDQRGGSALQRIRALGIDPGYITVTSGADTGIVTVRVEDGQPQFTIHRPAAYDLPVLSTDELAKLASWSPDWIYFGTLAQSSEQVRTVTQALLAAIPSARRFYDINLRVESYTLPLLRELLSQASVVKLNDLELEEVCQVVGIRKGSVEQFCRQLAAALMLEAVCVTRGAQGCGLLFNGEYVEHPGFIVNIADTVGAGDAFSAGLVHGIALAWPAPQIAEFCNRVGALVASRRGAIPNWRIDELQLLR